MGKVKNLLMDMQDDVYAILDNDTILGCECFEEFLAKVWRLDGFDALLAKYSAYDIKGILQDGWNDYWGGYL